MWPPAILCQATLGGLLDRWSRKPVLLVATGILTAVSAAFVGTSHLGWHVYGLRFLQGAALAIFTTSNLALTGATPLPPAGPAAIAQPLGRTFWRSYLPVLVPVFQYGLANAILFVFLPPFARQVGLARVGPFYLAYRGAALAVRVGAGRLADRFGRQRVILPSLMGMTAGILLCSVLHATRLLVLIGMVNGTAQGFVFPAGRNQALAIYNIANLAGAALGASGFGWLAQGLGFRPGFVLAGCLLAPGVLLFWRQW